MKWVVVTAVIACLEVVAAGKMNVQSRLNASLIFFVQMDFLITRFSTGAKS